MAAIDDLQPILDASENSSEGELCAAKQEECY